MFRDLEGRALTTEEEAIIAQRVALQRNMAEEFERRERARKVRAGEPAAESTGLVPGGPFSAQQPARRCFWRLGQAAQALGTRCC